MTITETPAVSTTVDTSTVEIPAAIAIAQAFHEAYERLAWERGYETREESRVPWDEVPDANRHLMVDTAKVLIAGGFIAPGRALAPPPVEGPEIGTVRLPLHTTKIGPDGAVDVPIGSVAIALVGAIEPDALRGARLEGDVVRMLNDAIRHECPQPVRPAGPITAHECASAAADALRKAATQVDPDCMAAATAVASEWRQLGQAIGTTHGMTPPRADQGDM